MADHAKQSVPSYADLAEIRLSRRATLLGLGSVAALAGLGKFLTPMPALAAEEPALGFTELTKIYDQTHHVAPGYRAEVLVRWGDPIVKGAAAYDTKALSADNLAKQFGYNCDFMGYLPLPVGSQNSENGLLSVNNEYADPHIMWPGLTEDDAGKKMSKEQVEAVMATTGHSIVEVKKSGGKWTVVADSPYNRRITSLTEMQISGPAAGHALLKTSADPTGTKVIGTGYNCSGGVTPWGTVLSCEEGLSDNFGGDPAKTPDPKLLERYGYDGSDAYGRARVYDRYVLDKEPNEPNRFDWVIEIDPYDPQAVPVKRTALGRFSHEAATSIVSQDGRVVVYLGDDDYFEYIYRFVSAGKFNASDRAANKNLLDDGALSVAKFDADGKLHWLPLVHGQGKLTAENGFADQAEVLIKARLAADMLGATPMDRPEDMEPNPVTGKVYAVMTKNHKRKPEQVDAANPRAENKYGHILELTPPGEGNNLDHTADVFAWDVFLLAGDPTKPEEGAKYNGKLTANGWFVNPDNIAFDPAGRLWIASDGANDFGIADGLYATETTGEGRALTKFFFACPTGAEMCGPCFTPDGKTLFVAVQHPGEDSPNADQPTTRWPDFGAQSLPRPSVVVISQEKGDFIGA
ncbi:MAG TPA: PhoX family phosphatase [Dongiaceae bacterium]|nr:PhoX family phosphatase [Dongiaceae bacterium]